MERRSVRLKDIDSKYLNALIDLKNSLNIRIILKSQNIGDNAQKLLDLVNKEILDKIKSTLEVYEFWTRKALFRYWKIIIDSQIKLYIYPYQYIDSNRCLFSVYFDMMDDYESGMKDSSIDIDKTLLCSDYEVEEVTEEEFRKSANIGLTTPLDKRLCKLKYRDKSI